MGKIHVTPDDLKSAAAAVGKAVAALSEVEGQGRTAQGHAKEIHYEPAAGKADAVAQKAQENLVLARDALVGLQRGFLAAAGVYVSNDQLVMDDYQKYAEANAVIHGSTLQQGQGTEQLAQTK